MKLSRLVSSHSPHLVSSWHVSSRLRSSTDVTVDEATLWHQMQTVHTRRHLCSCCSCFSFFHPLTLSLSHSPTLPASALSAAATCVRILLQRFVWFFSSLASSVFAKRKSQKVYATSRATKQSQKRQVSLASLFPLLPLFRSLSLSLSLSSPTCSCFHLCCQLILFRVKSSFFS